MILAGVAMASFLTSIQTYVQQQQSETLRQVYTWILGQLTTSSWREVLLVLPYVIVASGILLVHRRILDEIPEVEVVEAGEGLAPRFTTGRLIVVNRHLRDVHRFGYPSLAKLAEAGNKLVADGIAMVRNGGTAVQDDPDRPVFRGNGADDYVCVECGNLLAEAMHPVQMTKKVRVRCGRCSTPAPAAPICGWWPARRSAPR